MRKTCVSFGLQLIAGGFSQALDRLDTKVQCQYQAIVKELRQATVVHSNETSWWVRGPGWWLWAFVNLTSAFRYFFGPFFWR
jgi:hypothetical protein